MSEKECRDQPFGGSAPTLIQALCNFSGSLSSFDELAWRQVAECRAGSLPIEVDPLCFDPVGGIRHRQGPGRVQTLEPQAGVERFDVGVIRGFAWPREVDLDAVEIGPLVEERSGQDALASASVHPGAARRRRAVIADGAQGEAGQDWRDDQPTLALRRLPDGGGHHSS